MRPAAALRLGVGDRRVRHRLLVLAAPGRQRVADAVQRLADAGDVAVAEDRPDALDEALAVLGHLHAQPAHHRLRGGQSDRPLMPSPPVLRLMPPSPARPPAPCPRSRRAARIAAPSRRPPRRRSIAPVSQARAASPKIVRPTAKPFTRSKPAAVSKLAASSASGASRPSTTMPRVCAVVAARSRRMAFAQAASRGHRLELPPVGLDAGGVELLDQRRGGVVVDRADLGGDDLEQELQPVAARGVPAAASTVASWSARISGASSGWQKQSTLTTFSSAHSVKAAVVAAELRLQRQRPRARPFARAGRSRGRCRRRRAAPSRPSRLSQRMP